MKTEPKKMITFNQADFLSVVFNDIGYEVLECYEKNKYKCQNDRYLYFLYANGSVGYYDQIQNTEEMLEKPISEMNLKMTYPLCYRGNSYVYLPKAECLNYRKRMQYIVNEYKNLTNL